MRNLSSIIIFLYGRIKRLRPAALLLFCSFLFFFISTAIFISDEVVTQPVGWEKQTVLSPRGIKAENVYSSKKGSLAALVFEGKKGASSVIYASVSFNGGAGFRKPVKIAEFESSISNNPRVAIDKNGKIMVCWYRLSKDGLTGEMFMSESGDYGVTWGDAEKVSFGLQMEIFPTVYVDDRNRLHIFFTAMEKGIFNLFHSIRSSDGEFESPESISSLKGNLRGAFFPSVQFKKNNAVVIWQSKEADFRDHLYYVVSDNYGSSWSGVDKITTGRFNNQAPSFVISDDIIYLVFMNNSKKNWGIKLLRGHRYGSRWDEPVEVSTTNSNCYSPDIVVSARNELLITWHDSREKGNRIYYRKYNTTRRSMLDEKKLSFRERPGTNPVTMRSGEKIVVVWEEAGSIVANRTDTSVLAPEVVSYTHRQGRWTKNRDALIRWKKPRDDSGISGYATLFDYKSNTVPTIQNFRFDVNETLISGIKDGIGYFHIRAVDGAGNMSRTVHYKLQVSANPLSMPVIVSSTHREGKPGGKGDAELRWAVNDSRRLKGFLYSLGKDEFVTPNKLIDDFKISFSGLEKGVYYFNLAAVSKTNQISNFAIFSFIVGSEGKPDINIIKGIAKGEDEIRETKVVKRIEPEVKLKILNQQDGKLTGNEVELFLETEGVSPSTMSGYSVVYSKNRPEIPEIVNRSDSKVKLENIEKGEYYIGVKAKYFTVKNGKKTYYWTKPVFKKFRILIPLPYNPFEDYYADIVNRISSKIMIVSGILSFMLMLYYFSGIGSRFMFLFKKIFHKFSYGKR